jgi:hypothetical protein
MANATLRTFTLLMAISTCANGASLLGENKFGIKNLDLKLKTGLSNLESPYDKSTTFSSKVYINTEINLAQGITFNADAGLKFETGSATSSFDQRRYTPKSQISYDHAYLNMEVFDFLNIEAGALNNSELSNASRFTNFGTPFLGVREVLSAGNESISFDVRLTQALPYNDQLSERIGAVDEGSPKYYSEIANLTAVVFNTQFSLQAGHFAYQDLSSSVANEDRYFGNSVSGSTETNSSYLYNFKGWTYAAAIEKSFTNGLKISPAVEMVKNDEAYTGTNTGLSYTLGLSQNIENALVAATITTFENESDTAPAFYNGSDYKNNYKGNIYKVDYKNDEGLTTSLKYVDREVIESSLYLANEKVITLSLRKTYDIF